MGVNIRVRSEMAYSGAASTCSSRKSSQDIQDEDFFEMFQSLNTFGLDIEQVWNLRKVFDQFSKKNEDIPCVEQRNIPTIFRILSIHATMGNIEIASRQLGIPRNADLDFEIFVEMASKFIAEKDEETTKYELKEAFRIYDKHKQGYITIEVLKEILREIDAELTEDELDEIVTEVDEDGSGTVDFQEFLAMMTGE